MIDPVTTIPGIGPATKILFDRAGILSAEALRHLGADAAYRRLIETGTRPHFIGYYALHMSLQGRPWNDCKGKEKTEFRKRFDTLVADAQTTSTGPSPDLRQFLQDFGMI